MAAYFLNAVLAPHARGGWEAWITRPSLYSGPHETPEQAREAVLALLAAWCRNHGHDPDAFDVRWFDPARHLTYCDTVKVYPATDADRPFVGEHGVFLGYDGGKANVWLYGDPIRRVALDPRSLKPINVRKPW
jgi:hypothetical protein